MKILILNAGSSSLKFQLFSGTKIKNLKLLAKGVADAINQPHAYLEMKMMQDKVRQNEQKNGHIFYEVKIKDHREALQEILKQLLEQDLIKSYQEIELIGHRVVHGGEKYTQPIKLNLRVVQDLEKISKLAPLHNPANLQGIKSAMQVFPKARQIAVFDTSFHQTLEPKNYLYALPENLYKKHGIRRYGFHGINHQYISEQARKILKENGFGAANLITCHLGNGVSLTAVKNGKSVDTTMGFTPLEGVIMGTRSGSIDPAIALELIDLLKVSADEVKDILNKKSGLLALSKKGSDMRVVYEGYLKKDPNCVLAMEMYCQSIAKKIAELSTNLSQIDAIVFSAGIGENAHYVRTKIVKYLRSFGILLDQKANLKNSTIISLPESRTQVLVISAGEEIKIVEFALKLLEN